MYIYVRVCVCVCVCNFKRVWGGLINKGGGYICNFKRVWGGLINEGGGGWRLYGCTYKRNKRNVSERRDKTYLRNELKLTYHYI